MLKGAESKPKPMGDHKEKETVAIIATVGGATNIEIKLANSLLISVFEFESALVFFLKIIYFYLCCKLIIMFL